MRDDDKLVRQLSLVAFLMALGRPATAAEIHDAVEGYGGMSDQSFLRRFYSDRGELDALGIRLTVHRADDDPFQGDLYALPERDYYLGEIDFSTAELSALHTCLYLLEGQFAYAEPLRLALQHLTLGRPSPLDDQAVRSVSVDLLGDGYSAEVASHLAKIETAISRRKTIRFAYYTIGRDEHGERLVDPYSVLYLGGTWYLVGHSHERNAIRCFRLSRIEGRITFKTRAEHDFSYPRDLDISRYRDRAPWQLADPIGTATLGLSAEVAWWVDQRFGMYGQSETDASGAARYVTAFGSMRELVSWIMGLAPAITAHDPPELRVAVTDSLARVVAAHLGTPPPLPDERMTPSVGPGHGGHGPPAVGEGVVPAERFSRLLALMTGLLAACGSDPSTTIPTADLLTSLNIGAEVLEEDLNLLNLINFGGGCYALYAQVEGDQVVVVKERYGDQFARPARLSPLEAKALLWALEFIGDRLPLAEQDALVAVRARIQAALGDAPRPTVEIGRIHTANTAVAAALNESIRDDRVVDIEYWTESRGDISRREIEPHVLVNAQDAWYVVAFCRRANDRRTFRLDRIRSARVSERHFARRSELAQEVESPSGRAITGGVAARARVLCRPEIARWLVERHAARGHFTDGSALVDIPYASEDWLIKEILKHQGAAVLIEPRSLRGTIAARAQTILDGYDGATAPRRRVARR